jgi:endogenous inhibitor of DNA gyrase (YacG/DUF329 family)
MVENYDTENRPFPICPWCGEEMDIGDFDYSSSESASDTVRCPDCGKAVEVKVSTVYSTYTADEEDIIGTEDLFEVGPGYENELDPYENEDEEEE